MREINVYKLCANRILNRAIKDLKSKSKKIKEDAEIFFKGDYYLNILELAKYNGIDEIVLKAEKCRENLFKRKNYDAKILSR